MSRTACRQIHLDSICFLEQNEMGKNITIQINPKQEEAKTKIKPKNGQKIKAIISYKLALPVSLSEIDAQARNA